MRQPPPSTHNENARSARSGSRKVADSGRPRSSGHAWAKAGSRVLGAWGSRRPGHPDRRCCGRLRPVPARRNRCVRWMTRDRVSGLAEPVGGLQLGLPERLATRSVEIWSCWRCRVRTTRCPVSATPGALSPGRWQEKPQVLRGSCVALPPDPGCGLAAAAAQASVDGRQRSSRP